MLTFTSPFLLLRRSRSSRKSSSICSDTRLASASNSRRASRSESVSVGGGFMAAVIGSSWLYNEGERIVVVVKGREGEIIKRIWG